MIKLVATDIDGTLLIPEGQFTEGVKKCVQKLCQKGIKVVLVTGRMNAAASLIAEDLGLDTPVVSYQGGLIKQNGKTLYERCLTPEQTEKIIDWAASENIHLNLYNDCLLYTSICPSLLKQQQFLNLCIQQIHSVSVHRLAAQQELE